MKATHGRIIAFASALAVGLAATVSGVSYSQAATPRAFTYRSAAPARADTLPIRFHTADTAIRLGVGTFGPCARDFDPHTRVASIYCPKAGSPEEREFIFVNVYFSDVWADSADAQSVARIIRDNKQPGLITEAAFSAPAGQTTTAQTYYLAQTHVEPDGSFGNVYVIEVSQTDQAAVAIIYGQRFDAPSTSMRVRTRQWLLDNVKTHSRELSRISLDASWFVALRSLAR